jgi:hypothetical protein
MGQFEVNPNNDNVCYPSTNDTEVTGQGMDAVGEVLECPIGDPYRIDDYQTVSADAASYQYGNISTNHPVLGGPSGVGKSYSNEDSARQMKREMKHQSMLMTLASVFSSVFIIDFIFRQQGLPSPIKSIVRGAFNLIDRGFDAITNRRDYGRILEEQMERLRPEGEPNIPATVLIDEWQPMLNHDSNALTESRLTGYAEFEAAATPNRAVVMAEIAYLHPSWLTEDGTAIHSNFATGVAQLADLAIERFQDRGDGAPTATELWEIEERRHSSILRGSLPEAWLREFVTKQLKTWADENHPTMNFDAATRASMDREAESRAENRSAYGDWVADAVRDPARLGGL